MGCLSGLFVVMPTKSKKDQKDRIISGVAKEMRRDPPKVLSSTKKKFGVVRAERQRKAILLSKSRKLGARIPR